MNSPAAVGFCVVRELRRRIAAYWQQKLVLTAALNLLFWAGYGFLSRNAFFPLHKIPLTWLDEWVTFRPEPWAWIYVSQFLYVAAVPWLIECSEDIRRYALGLVVMSGTSFLVFLFLPVASPRPGDFAPDAFMRFIQAYDGSLNAFPSLHAGFLVYTFGFGWRLFRARLSASVIVPIVLWGGLVMYSTLATKQHYFWDLIAGAAIGYVADKIAWGEQVIGKQAQAIARNTGVMSQAGDK